MQAGRDDELNESLLHAISGVLAATVRENANLDRADFEDVWVVLARA